MKEFMLLIRNIGDHASNMPKDQHEEFLQKCRDYIAVLEKDGKLIAAQPLKREGVIISGSGNSWKEMPYNNSVEVQVGYYHILANDLDDAVTIAKRNPEFEYGPSARIEVRPIKMKEESTGYVYPKIPTG